jgi:amidase
VIVLDEGLTRRGARELAALVRGRAASAEEVARAHLERIDALASLGAFQVVDRDRALEDARAVDANPERRAGPLAGVPVAVKDNFDVAGYPTRLGSAATSDRPARSDDEAVRRLRAAGAFVIGKTTMPELGIWPFTEGAAFGLTRNPWSPDRTAGGSTGGGAVAVAARMATLALGSDGGGSIRIPAACCGVVGYKPAPRLLPLPGNAATHWLGLSAAGPLARSADDAALMLDVLAGRPPRPPLASPTTPLRIAVSTRAILIGGRVDPEVIAATRDVAQRLARAGAMVIEADPPYPLDISLRFSRRWFAGIAEEAERLDAARLEPRTRSLARVGSLVRRLGLASPVAREPLGEELRRWFGGHDLLLAPTLSSPAVPHGAWKVGWLATTLRAGNWIMTAQWNLVAFPAVSVPAGLSKDGLPLAVQLSAPPGREDVLLAAAHQVGELMPALTWGARAG